VSGPLSHDDIFAGWQTVKHHHHRIGNVFEMDLTSLKGARVELGEEFKKLVFKYGRAGVIRGWDTSVAYQEVRQFDFSDWPWMSANDRKALKRLVHTPEWVLISAYGMKAAQPVTGKWVRRGDKQFDRLSKLPVVGTVNEEA
jgi:hypothetical protein